MTMTREQIETGAQFSSCRTYRYALWRTWDKSCGHAMFVGLNPSTADETVDDPTIRRCVGFARSWGYGGIYMLNLFAFRATDPKVMKAASDPIGPENNEILIMYSHSAGIVVAAWGVHGRHMERDGWACDWLPQLHHLGLTKDMHPRHPLYLKGDTKPTPWFNVARAI